MRRPFQITYSNIYIYILYVWVPLCEYNVIIYIYIRWRRQPAKACGVQQQSFCPTLPPYLPALLQPCRPNRSKSPPGKSSSLRRRRNPKNRDGFPIRCNNRIYIYIQEKAITLIRYNAKSWCLFFFYYDFLAPFVLTRAGDNAKTLFIFFFLQKNIDMQTLASYIYVYIIYFAIMG